MIGISFLISDGLSNTVVEKYTDRTVLSIFSSLNSTGPDLLNTKYLYPPLYCVTSSAENISVPFWIITKRYGVEVISEEEVDGLSKLKTNVTCSPVKMT